MQCARLIAETLVFGASCLGKSLSLKKCNCNIFQLRSNCAAESFSVLGGRDFLAQSTASWCIQLSWAPTFKLLLSPWSHTLSPAVFTFSRNLLVVQPNPLQVLLAEPTNVTKLVPFKESKQILNLDKFLVGPRTSHFYIVDVHSARPSENVQCKSGVFSSLYQKKTKVGILLSSFGGTWRLVHCGYRRYCFNQGRL